DLEASASSGGASIGATVHLVSITNGAKSRVCGGASGNTLSLALDPLTVTIANGVLLLNRATGPGRVESGSCDPTHSVTSINVDDTRDLHISGTVTVTFTGLFSATGTGSLDLGQVDDVLVGGKANYIAVDLNASVGGGGASVGATVHLVSITNG